MSIETIIAYILRTGLWISVIIVSIGGALYLLQNGSHVIHYQILETKPVVPVLTILQEASTLSAEGIISLGLFVLVLTQVVRVALTVVLFLIERDFVFVLISLLIFIALMYSIFWRR